MKSISVPVVAASDEPQRRSLGLAAANLFADRPPKFYVGLVLAGVIIAAVLLADALPIKDPFFSHRGFELTGPSWRFLLGTDEIGRDLLSRIIYGGRPSLIAAFVGVTFAAVIGVPMGLASGLQGGALDNIVGRVADATFALPTILIGVGLAAALGSGGLAVTLAIIIGSWPSFVRVARASALQEKALPYIEALRALGAGRMRIIFRHILPNSIEPLAVQFTVAIAIAVLVESGLSFLGMGAQPPAPSWGGLLADSRRYLLTAAYYAIFPGITISMLVIGVNFIADGFRRGVDVSPASRSAAPAANAKQPANDDVLRIDDLRASFGGKRGRTPVLNGVSLSVPKGETLGIVGESGSGKSVTAFTATGLNRRQPIKIDAGAAWLHDDELIGMPERALSKIRGRDIGMIFQNPAAALNPITTVGRQIAEAVRAHRPDGSKEDVGQRVLDLLRQVQLPDPERVAQRYPHELSGGQRQRIVIAMAIANAPSLIIADEPTTALDVTVQAQVLELLKEISARPGSSLVMITHDLGVVAETADRVAVMYYGRVVEAGPVERIFKAPTHPYTRGLLTSIPRVDRRTMSFHAIPGAPPRPGDIQLGCAFAPRCEHRKGRALCVEVTPELRRLGDGMQSACHFAEELMGAPELESAETGSTLAPADLRDAPALLSARGVTVAYGDRKSKAAVAAVRGVDIDLRRGVSLGVVGESGCGKSSLLRALMRLPAPQAGAVAFEGVDFDAMAPSQLRSARRDLQIVQQDPSTALDRRMSVLATVREALDIHGVGVAAERDARARDYLARVGIGSNLAHRLPATLSGGQQQRVAIARALVLHPKALLLDEAFSALDLSVRAQVLNLLSELRSTFRLTYLFVSHDLSIIRSVADEIAIMYLGRIVERGTNEQVFGRPQHPYTIALLSAVPTPDPTQAKGKKRIILQGDPPDPANPPTGCAFRNRCWKARPACADATPQLEPKAAAGGDVACFFPE